jgi:hypothetical protein
MLNFPSKIEIRKRSCTEQRMLLEVQGSKGSSHVYQRPLPLLNQTCDGAATCPNAVGNVISSLSQTGSTIGIFAFLCELCGKFFQPQRRKERKGNPIGLAPVSGETKKRKSSTHRFCATSVFDFNFHFYNSKLTKIDARLSGKLQ